MKENETQSKVKQYRGRMIQILWELLRNNKISLFLYIILLLIDFGYQLLLLLGIFGQEGCLPFAFNLFDEIFNEVKLEQLSIAAITFSFWILAIIALLVSLILKKVKKIYKQEALLAHPSHLYQILSFNLILIKNLLFTIILQTLLYQIITIDLQQSTVLTQFAFYSSLLGICLLLVLQYLMTTFLNFIMHHESLPFAETSNKAQLNEMIYRIIFVVCFLMRDNKYVLYPLATLSLLTLAYQIYLKFRKAFIINQIVHRVAFTITLTRIYLLLMTLIQTIFTDKENFFYYVLLNSAAPVVIGFVLSAKRERRLMTVLNQSDEYSVEEVGLSLIFLLDAFNQCKKTETKNWINQFYHLHSVLCPEFFLTIQAEKLKEDMIKAEEKKHHHNSKTYDLSAPQDRSHSSPSRMQYKVVSNKSVSVNISLTDKFRSMQDSSHQSLAMNFTSSMKRFSKNNYRQLFQQQDKIFMKYYQLSKHFFKDHILNNSSTDSLVLLSQICYVQVILENPYLTQFLILLFNDTKERRKLEESFMNEVVLLYIQERVNRQYYFQKQSHNLDIQNILNIDEMISKFDLKMASVTWQIEKFWKQLSNDTQSGSTFKDGINLAVDLNKLEQLYVKIQCQYQTRSQNEVQIRMQQFTWVVLSKSQILSTNSQNYLDNAKSLILKETGSQTEKALLVSNFSTRDYMSVIFVNKNMTRMLKYAKEDILGKPVNIIMPQVIGENHNKFIDNYVLSWKQRMTHSRNQFFVKDSRGYLESILMQTFPNIVNNNQMVLILEHSKDFSHFDDEDTLKQQCYLITDQEFMIKELSNSFPKMTGVDYEFLREQHDALDKVLHLDDLLTIYNPSGNVLLGDFKMELEFNQLYRSQIKDARRQQLKNGAHHLAKDIFNLLVIPYGFMKSQVQFYLVCLQVMTEVPVSEVASDSAVQFSSAVQRSSKVVYDPEAPNFNSLINSESISELGNEISSQSSSGSRQISQMQSRSIDFTSIVNKTSTPLTLSFINQISLAIITIILVASAITLGLVLNSQDNAQVGIIVNNYALQRINGMSQMRTVLRTLGSIANGFQANQSPFIQDRFFYYLNIFEQGVQQTRKNQIEVNKYVVDSPILDPLFYSQIKLLNKNLSVSTHNFTTEYAVNQYINSGFDVYEAILDHGQSYLESDLDFMQIGDSNRTSATLDERTYFYILQQAKDNLYFQTRTYSQNFILYEKEQIEDKAAYNKILTFVCIALIGVSAIALIPFFTRVQKRIHQLMDIFTMFDKVRIQEILQRINEFKSFQEKSKQAAKGRVKKREEPLLQNPTPETQKMRSTRQAYSTDRKLVGKLSQKKEGEEEENEESFSEREEGKGISLKKKTPKKASLEIEQESAQKKITQKQLDAFLAKRNAFQIVLIIVLAGFACFFFLIQYLQSLRSFEEMNSSISSMNDIGLKDFITGGLIYAINENYLMNETTMAVNNEGGKMSMANFLTGEFQSYDSDYKERVLKQQSKHLGTAREHINMLESTSFCSVVFGNNSEREWLRDYSEYLPIEEAGVYTMMTVEECEESGVALQGLNNVLLSIFLECQQLIIDYQATLESFNRTEPFLRAGISGSIAEITDLYYIFCCNQISAMLNMAFEGISGFFNTVTKQFIVIYICFLLGMALVIVFMKFNVLRKLCNEMHLSNKLLYIIDFEGLKEEEQLQILKFLKEY